MNKHHFTWQRLARRAQAAPPEELALPFGFSTRVVAQWRTQALPPSRDMWESVMVRGVGVAFLLFLGCSVWGYEAFSNTWSSDSALAADWLQNLLAQ